MKNTDKLGIKRATYLDESRPIIISKREEYNELLRLLERFGKETGNANQLSIILQEEEQVPASIFASVISPLEAVVLFLDRQGLTIAEIARKLNRDQRTIWTTLRNARKRKAILAPDLGHRIPLRLFADRRLSILEHTVLFLKEKGMRHKDISVLLHKAPNTIWTACHRATEKGGRNG